MNFFDLPIFFGFSEEECQAITRLSCFWKKDFTKDAVIFHKGDRTGEAGVVLSGSVNIESTDLWGNKSILSNIRSGHIFAETYALCREPMMVDVVAAENSEVLFINLCFLLGENNRKESWYAKLISNLLGMTAQKNIVLSNRIFFTSAKTIRSRLLSYFTSMSVKSGTTTFQIPFNRQQLADYLNLDRSALSKELCKMRDDGLIEFYKNSFKLKNTEMI